MPPILPAVTPQQEMAASDLVNSVKEDFGDQFGLDSADDLDDDFDDDDDGSEGDIDESDTNLKRKFDQGEDEERRPRKKKRQKSDKVRPPTANEMTHLRETENLFQSNLFRLQIEEMMSEIKPKKTYRQAMKPWIESFKKFVAEIDEITDLPLDNLKWVKKLGVKLPLRVDRFVKSGGTFNFLKPVDVLPIGAYAIGAMSGPHFTVDIALVMPKKCFKKEDRLSGRYLLKRALYLSVVGSRLEGSQLLNGGVKWCLKSGDPSKPFLSFAPQGRMEKYATVTVHAVPQKGAFIPARLLPHISNLPPHSPKAESVATPHYNASLMEDVVLEENEALRAEVIGTNESLREAISLLRVWLTQRQLAQGYGAFSAYIMSMLIVHLFKTHVINVHMSSYQIIRHVWLFLRDSDWRVEGATMKPALLVKCPELALFHSHYEVVFVDPTGHCNLTASVNRFTFLKVKHEAKLAIEYLDSPEINSFQALFMTKMPFLHQYDHFICLNKREVVDKLCEKVLSGGEVGRELIGCDRALVCRGLASLVVEGLGKRITEAMVDLGPSPPPWPLSDTPSSPSSLPILIGLALHSEHALALLDKGPQANLPQASEFRSFWGSRSSLRRFRDGEVCESVVWAEEGCPLSQRRLIPRQVVQFLLQDKLQLGPDQYVYIAGQIDSKITPSFTVCGDVEEGCLRGLAVLDELQRGLRALTGLPLSITNVQCISPIYRFTELFPSRLVAQSVEQTVDGVKDSDQGRLFAEGVSMKQLPLYQPTIDLVAELGSSQKWPSQLEAGRRLISAFNIALAPALAAQFNCETQIGKDSIIIFKSGYAFRVFLGYDKEIALVKTEMKSGFLQFRENPQSSLLEKKFIHLPKISGALHGLSERFAGFGRSACTAKRWVRGMQIDSSAMPDLLIELVTASLFLSPQPFCAPVQPLCAFLRFLHTVANTHWHSTPLVLNFNNLLSRDEVRRIEERVVGEGGGGGMLVVTPWDKEGTLWSQPSPSLPTLLRMAALARSSLNILQQALISQPEPSTLLSVFKLGPDKVYDAVILMEERMLVWAKGSRKGAPLPAPASAPAPIPILNFDPVQIYLRQLRENYSDYALFFHNSYDGPLIGVLFKPSALAKKGFKGGDASCRKPELGEGKANLLELNLPALISDFYTLGTGIVRKIIVGRE